MHGITHEPPQARWLGWLGAAALLVLGGCSGPPETVAQTDFDSIYAWGLPPAEWTTREKAHSGEVAAKMQPAYAFGPGFRSTWGELQSPRRLRLSAWVYLPHSRLKTALVIDVLRAGESLYRRQLMMNEAVRHYNRWEPVTQTFYLPADLQPDDEVKIYAWHFDTLYEWYLDDIVVEKLS